MKNNILKRMGTSILTGGAFVFGGIIMILGVTAFESLTTTPGDSGNQSLGSIILSKTIGDFNRDTDSLEALSETINSNASNIATITSNIATIDGKIDTLSAAGGGGVFTKCQIKRGSLIYPTCPAGFNSIHNYASAQITYWFRASTDYRRSGISPENIVDSSWSSGQSSQSRRATLVCTICEKN